MTDIQSTLSAAAKALSIISDTALLDAEVLLCHVLAKPRSHLRAWPEKQLSAKQQEHFQSLFQQRRQGTPIAYITGHREFWSRDFKVNSNVLIPRPDTELIIELSLQLLANNTNAHLIDLGTGSGAIAITLAAERPDLRIFATDFSQPALKTAKENAHKYSIKNIQFIHSDWFTNVPESKFDLIISNPPYIAQNDPHLSEGDIRFEPTSALVSPDQGLKDIKTISQQASTFLKPESTLMIEHGFSQKTAVQTIFNALNYTNVTTYNDLSGNPRVTTGQWQF